MTKPPRTRCQREANEVDLAMHRLASRALQLGLGMGSLTQAQRVAWTRIATRITVARRDVRRLMHPQDVEGTTPRSDIDD